MENIKKLELPLNDPRRGIFNSGAGNIQIIRKINEIIDRLNERPEETDPTKGCDCDFCRGYRWSHEKEENTPEEWEKKDWKYRFRKLFYNSGYDYDIPLIEQEVLKDFISKELDKAREEGYEQGYKECKKDFAVGVGMHNDPEFSEIVSKVAEKLSKLKTVSNMEEKIECDIKEKTYYLTEEEFEIVKQMLGDPTEELSDCCGAEVDEHGADDHTSRCLGCGEFCGIVYVWD